MDRLDAAGHAAGDAAVQLSGARISGNLMLRGARLANRSGPALMANDRVSGAAPTRTPHRPGLPGVRRGAGRALSRCAVGPSPGNCRWNARGSDAGPGRPARQSPGGSGAGPGADRAPCAGGDVPPPPAPRSVGAVCLSGSTIAGNLVPRHHSWRASAMSALMAEKLTVQGHAGACESRHEGRARPARRSPPGGRCLVGASVTGQLSLRGSTLINASGPAIPAGRPGHDRGRSPPRPGLQCRGRGVRPSRPPPRSGHQRRSDARRRPAGQITPAARPAG